MNSEAIFSFCIAALSFVFALFNYTNLFRKRHQTAQTKGTILSLTSPNPETAQARNSKWAEVMNQVNGVWYTSQKRNTSSHGITSEPVTVRYDLTQPEKLYSFSLSRVFGSLFTTIVCVTAAIHQLL